MKAIRVALAFALLAASFGSASAQFDFLGEPDTPPWQQFKLDPKVRIKLDFRNASVDAVLQTLSKASGVGIVKDPSLTGPLTLQSPSSQKLSDAFAMLSAALGLRSYEIRKEGTFLVIRQKAQRGSTSRLGSFGSNMMDPSAMFGGGAGGRTDSLVLRVYSIKFANATQVARVINDVFAIQATSGGGMFPGMFGMPGMPGGMPGVTPGGGAPGAPPAGPRTGAVNDGDSVTAVPVGQRGRGGMGGFGMDPMAMMQGGMFGGRRGGGSTSTTVRASADDYSNSVIVYASTRDHEQIQKLIEQIDKQSDQPQTSRVFPLQYAAAADLVTTIQSVLTSNANKGRGATTNTSSQPQFPFGMRMGGGNSQVAVSADQRTNSLVVTATLENLVIVEKVVKELDTPVKYESSAFVISLENARADTVAQLINQSFGSGRSTGGTGNTTRRTTTTGAGNRGTTGARGGGTPTLNSRAEVSELEAAAEEEEVTRAAAAAAAAQGMGGMGFGQGFNLFGGGGQGRTSSQNQSSVGRDSQGRLINVRDLTGAVQAIADVNTNSVIIVTSPQNRELLEQILSQLDKIPEQVMIETLIVEASLDTASKLGVEWNFASGSSTGTGSFGLKADTAQPQGLRYTLTGSQYGVFLQALKTDSRFEVLSTPRIFTSNNSQAEINISQSLPYVTNQRVDSNGNYSYSYSFLDVGIILNVTPRISANGYVTMDVTQTANDFVRYTDFNAPVVNQREAQTTVSVMDGETVVLGGIIKNSVTSTAYKVPLLGDIPLLGGLFKSTNQSKSKTELLVFLTPHVVRDPAEAAKLRQQTEKQMQSKALGKLLDSRPVQPEPTVRKPKLQEVPKDPAQVKPDEKKPEDVKPEEKKP